MALYRVLDGAKSAYGSDPTAEVGTEFEWDGTEVDCEGDIRVATPDGLSTYVLPAYVELVNPPKVQVVKKTVTTEVVESVTLNLTVREVGLVFAVLADSIIDLTPIEDVYRQLAEVCEV